MSILLVWYAVPTFADEPEKFSPEKFLAEMEKYITKEAKLTNEEASKFFPLLREMHAKQRVVYDKIKKECNIQSSNDAECKKAVQKRDVYELELKTIQQTYHNKFLKVLPPSKSMMPSGQKTVSTVVPLGIGAVIGERSKNRFRILNASTISTSVLILPCVSGIDARSHISRNVAFVMCRHICREATASGVRQECLL